MFGWPRENIIGRNIRELIPADRQNEEDAIIARIASGQRMATFETIRLRRDGSQVHVAVTVSPVFDKAGRVVAASKIARDITGQRATLARLEQSEQRFRLLADNISQLAWIANSDGWIFWYNQRWFDYTGTTLDDMQGWGWKSVHHPDHIDDVVEKISRCFQSGEDWEDTFPLRRADGQWRWFLSRAKAIRNDAGAIVFWFGTNTDVTAMRDAEERIELLLQEVNHRSKNMLAIVQSLARRADAARPDFFERLEQRIGGLAANQDVLVRRAWSNIPVMEMIEAQLRSLGDSQPQVHCDGPPVMLSSAAAETLAMALHEMGTNALKYGALSHPEGRVGIAWDIGEDTAPGDRRFRITWQEQGGPSVSPPERQGFGTRIIIDVPRAKLNAIVEVDYAPQGFRWQLTCPVAALG